MTSADTIAAVSSAVGPAARMILRVSGRHAHEIARSFASRLPEPGGASCCDLRFNELSVPSWVYLFAAPRSYTSQDLVEFHVPGNPLLARLLLDTIVTIDMPGVRLAEPGEFTARAYFSGKLDLTEAEGVAATIGAHSQHELDAARQLMAGELSRRLRPRMDSLTDTLALVEAGIDFSDEDVSFITADDLTRRIEQIDADFDDLVRTSDRFEPLTHEPTFVLVGRPNAGKSTLLNALAGYDRAVVSPQAGTTRDVLVAEVRLKRGLVHVIDLAGLEEAIDPAESGASADISRQMQQQALRAVESSDRIIYVREITDSRPPIATTRNPDLTVTTKADLAPSSSDLCVSALTGLGMDELRARLDRLAFGESSVHAKLALNARHLRAIADARSALARALAVARTGGAELIALELRDALDSLGQVLGQVTPDDVLGRVFATFCIGK